MTELEALAAAAGIQRQWHEQSGAFHEAGEDVLRAVLRGLGLACDSEADAADSRRLLHEEERARPLVTGDLWQPILFAADPGPALLTLEDGRSFDLHLDDAGDGRVRLRPILEPGYHQLETAGRTITVAIAPERCVSVEALTGGRRAWGAAVQLYSLRDSGGYGDLGALAALAPVLAQAGADAIAISPIHALFTADPGQPSPYSASTRRFLNPWYADPVLAGARQVSGAADPPLIDWRAAVPARLSLLRECWAAANAGMRAAVDAFTNEGGPALRAHATFEALQCRFHAESGAHGWRDWPTAFHDPSSAEVVAYAASAADEIGFHIFLQWLTDASLARAQAAATRAGMATGLIADVALGVDPAGSDGWAARDTLMAGLTLGSPPDAFNAHGQEWGITGFSPRALAAKGFAPYLSMLRAAMRHAGGVRLDHALGLRRLFVVPAGASPADGVYLGQSEADLLRLIALESQRHRALVIGEDLGTVAEGFREAIGARGIYGMRVLQFERDWTGNFTPPAHWAPAAVALTSTHDLPPVAGWWKGCDIAWRARLEPGFDRASAEEKRGAERASLWRMASEQGAAHGPQPDAAAPVVDAALDLVSAAPAPLALLPMEDLLGLDEAPNLPGTVDEHPNWRRRLPLDAAGIAEDVPLQARLARIAARRSG